MPAGSYATCSESRLGRSAQCTAGEAADRGGAPGPASSHQADGCGRPMDAGASPHCSSSQVQVVMVLQNNVPPQSLTIQGIKTWPTFSLTSASDLISQFGLEQTGTVERLNLSSCTWRLQKVADAMEVSSHMRHKLSPAYTHVPSRFALTSTCSSASLVSLYALGSTPYLPTSRAAVRASCLRKHANDHSMISMATPSTVALAPLHARPYHIHLPA